MAIDLYISSSHSKIDYSNATDEEINNSEKILRTNFRAKDSSMARNPLVQRGIISDIVNFYIESHQLLPTGLIPMFRAFLRKANIEFKTHDIRKSIKHDEKFLSSDMKFGNLIPRYYQIDAVKEAVKYRNSILQLPVGSGKTLIMAIIAKTYPNSKILILSDSIDLIAQTRNELINEFKLSENEVGVIQGQNFEDNKRITLLSIQSYEKAQHIFPKINVIIVDETHVCGRNPTGEKIIYSCQNASVKIGLTATTEIDNPAERMRMFANVGPIVYNSSIKEKIDEGFLSKVNVKMFRFNTSYHIPIEGTWGDIYDWIAINGNIGEKLLKNIDSITDNDIKIKTLEELEEYLEILKIKKNKNKSIEDELALKKEEKILDSIIDKIGYVRDKRYNKPHIKKFVRNGDESNHYVFNDERNDKIVEIVKGRKRVVILFERISHGKELLKRIPTAMLVEGSSSKQERELAKKLIKDNENQTVLASGIFAKGVNIPEICTFVNAGGGKDTCRVIQKLGRSTRLAKNINKTSAVVIDFYDEFTSIAKKQSERRFNIYHDVLDLPVEII